MESTKSESNATPSELTNKKIINIHRVLDLPIRKVWLAWTEPEICKKWWGPKDYTCPYSSIDLKTGGKYLSCMLSPKGEEFWSTGVYNEIIPNTKIVFTDNFSDKEGNIIAASDIGMPGQWPKELLITVNFERAGEKTKMNLQHEGIPDEMYEECIKGWNESFDKMEKNI